MPKFWEVIERLEEYYGRPSSPEMRDPFELVLFEMCAYLQSDDKRVRAFRELKKRVGTKPLDVLTADVGELTEMAAMGGIHAPERARRMVEAAEIAQEQFGVGLRAALKKLPLKEARKALQKFPMIGEPGADKILLFSGSHACLGLDSNGLRALVRLGIGEEHKNYSTMYRRTMERVGPELGADGGRLMAAHQVLRRHGQETCKSSWPRCEGCAVRMMCNFHDAETFRK